MPQDDFIKNLSIYAHVQAVAMSLHYLKLKLRDVIKASAAPDDMMPNVLRLVSKDLADSKVEIDRNIVKLERHSAKLKKSVN